MLLLILAACWTQQERIDLSEAKVGPAMADHDAAAEAARAALLRGDLEALRASGEAMLREWPVRGMPAPLADRQEPVREAARAMASANDLEDGALALARLGAACGGCHGVGGKAVALPPDPGLAPGAGLPEQMKRHAWAAELVWLGLTGPSEQAFSEAYSALAAAPMVPSGTPIDAPVPAEAVALEVRVHDLAAWLRDAPPEDRPRLAGELFATCAACHGLLQGGPGTP